MFALLVIIVILLLYFYFNSRNKVQCDLPGPKPKPIIGNSLEFLSEEPLSALIRLTKQYGHLYKITLASDLFVIMTDPVDVEVILSNIKYNSKALSYKYISSWLKDGLITSDGDGSLFFSFNSVGDIWHRHRKLLTPTFHFKILENSIEVMSQNVDILCKQLKTQVDNGNFDVQLFVERCSLDIICESAMDVQVNSQTSEDTSYLRAVKTVTEITVNRIFKLWLQPEVLYNLCGYAAKFNESLIKMESLSKEVITSKRQKLCENPNKQSSIQSQTEKKSRVPFLDWMLTESEFTDEEVHSEVMSFMFAGHDTTTTGISFCIYQLSKYQEIQENVYKELTQVLPNNSSPSIQDLGNLKYMECVIKETFRLFPPVPMIGRYLPEAVKLPSGNTLPAKTQINVFIYQMHRDPQIFHDPENFLPERFMGDKTFPSFSYIPFSAGPRNCIGQRFAMLEIKIILSKILKQYQLLPALNSEQLTLTSKLILRSENGIPIRLVERK